MLQLSRAKQIIEQRLRLLQIGGVEPLGEPAIDGGEVVAGLGGSAIDGRRKLRHGCRSYDVYFFT